MIDLVRQGRYPHRTLFGRWSLQDDTACETALDLTGMTELRERRVEQLSGGQRQRAWIAMTLAQETDILLLDEPTTYLDLAHQIEVNQAARYADRVIMMTHGRIHAEGAAGEVVTADTIEAVFNVRSKVVPDPVTGTPMCIPIPG